MLLLLLQHHYNASHLVAKCLTIHTSIVLIVLRQLHAVYCLVFMEQ